jgi:hypothetical protein
MHVKALSQLNHGLFTFQGFHSHFGFEGRLMIAYFAQDGHPFQIMPAIISRMSAGCWRRDVEHDGQCSAAD